jgi:NADH-quinone oxidoreductase subunit J
MSDAKVYFFFLLATFLVTSLWVLLSRKLINMIVAIGIGSILLSILFFFLGTPFAGAFELSVGAGLISILFLIATSLSKRNKDKGESE